MRWTRLIIALGVAAAIPAAPAQADPTIDFSLSPDRVRPGDTITYKVTIKTGAEAERFGLKIGPRPIDHADGRPRWPLIKSAGMHYEGPGTVEYRYATPGGRPSCSAFGFRSTRGAVNETVTLAWLELPAGTTSTLTVTGDTAFNGMPALTPRLGEVYGLGFETRNDDWGQRQGTLDAPGALTAPVTTPADGRRGVWLSMATEPQSPPVGFIPCPTLPVVREPVVVRGRTDPALPGQSVLIEGGSRGAKSPEVIGSAVVGADGTFSFGPWTPPAPGDYEIRAIYRSQSPDFADDAMDGAYAFRYEPPPVAQTPAPAPTSAVVLPSSAAVRRGVARVRVICPQGTTGCQGSLRLRRGRVTWGRTAFSVAPGKAQTLRVRLSRRARATLSRRRGVRVQLDVVQQGAANRTLRLSLRR